MTPNRSEHAGETSCATASSPASASIPLPTTASLQDELASALAQGKPLLVMREDTERPEVLDAGVAILVGTEADRIVETFARGQPIRAPPGERAAA